jgi:xanthine dehydrogenase iron-sulfur cluster and FAD-binding subunit A
LAAAGEPVGPVDVVGTTVVADPARRRSHEVDLLAVRDGRVVALGEAKLRTLGPADLERLLRIRDLLNAPKAKIVLASATGVDPQAGRSPDVIAIEPADVYG